MAKTTYRVEMTATKVVEVTIDENDMESGETSLEDAAQNLAGECAFRNSYPEMVAIVEDWDVTVETVEQVKKRAA